jgi:hypothetical protein
MHYWGAMAIALDQNRVIDGEGQGEGTGACMFQGQMALPFLFHYGRL